MITPRILELTCIHTQTEHLFRHFERPDIFWTYIAVQYRVKLSHHPPFYQIHGVDTSTVFGYYGRPIKVSACKLIKVVTWPGGKVHF